MDENESNLSESALVGETFLNSLPDQVAALSQAKKEHAIEVAKLKSLLKELEVKFTDLTKSMQI